LTGVQLTENKGRKHILGSHFCRQKPRFRPICTRNSGQGTGVAEKIAAGAKRNNWGNEDRGGGSEDGPRLSWLEKRKIGKGDVRILYRQTSLMETVVGVNIKRGKRGNPSPGMSVYEGNLSLAQGTH